MKRLLFWVGLGAAGVFLLTCLSRKSIKRRPPGEFMEDLSAPSGDGPVKIKCLIHEADEGGFWAEVPSLPGCFTQGETLDEVKANLRDAIECYLDAPGAEGAVSDHTRLEVLEV